MGKTPLNFWFEGNGPSYFYKFRDISKFTRTIIVKSELYFGSAEDFNDPFDFLPIFTMKADRKPLQRYLEDTVPNRPRAERRKFAAQIISAPNFPEYEKQAMAVAQA